MDLRHIDEVEGSNIVDIGMDLSEFYMSVEWDILEVPAVRYNSIFYFASFFFHYFRFVRLHVICTRLLCIFLFFSSAGLLRRVGPNNDPPAVELLGYLIFLKRLGTLEKRKSGRLSGISVELLGQIPA